MRVRVFVELAPRVAKEKIDERDDDRKHREWDQRLRGFDESLKARWLGRRIDRLREIQIRSEKQHDLPLFRDVGAA